MLALERSTGAAPPLDESGCDEVEVGRVRLPDKQTNPHSAGSAQDRVDQDENEESLHINRPLSGDQERLPDWLLLITHYADVSGPPTALWRDFLIASLGCVHVTEGFGRPQKRPCDEVPETEGRLLATPFGPCG